MLEVADGSARLQFAFADLARYHGPGSPGGVAHAYRVLELALPRLGAPPERRSIAIRTAFGGPGARDGFELVTRAVTEGRYVVDPALARPGLGIARERFVFLLSSGPRTVTLVLRDGYVTEEFIALARRDSRTPDEEAHLDVLKREMAARVLEPPATEVYEVEPVQDLA
jgi:hypothetical protein